jgi:hypothetical protein
LWYVKSKLTYVNHNKVVLVSSVYAACFVRADRPQALKHVHYLKQKIKCVYIYKVIPLQVWTGSVGSRRFRLPDFKTVGTLRW